MQTTGQGNPELSQSTVAEDETAPASSPAGSANRKTPDACVICLEPVSERAVAVPCNHCAFDFICITTWVQANPACPLCKTDLTAIQYDWRSPHDYKEYHVIPDRQTAKESSVALIRRPRAARPRASRYRPYPASPSTEENTARLDLDLAVSRRRYVYRHMLYSLHVGSNRVSCFKDFTPQTFSQSAELQSRARKWIRRELQVFDFLSPNATSTDPGPQPHARSGRATNHCTNQRRNTLAGRTDNAEFLLEYIIAILRTVDIKGSSGRAQGMLTEFLGEENARLFLHELSAWLRSPYTSLEDWDRHVQYRIKLPGFSGIPQAANPDSESCESRGASQHDLARFRQRGVQARRRYEAD